MKKTCIQCGNEFEMTDSEISFYEGKGLELPKRCPSCRKANKKSKARRYHDRKKGDGKYRQGEGKPYNREYNRENTGAGREETQRYAKAEDIMRESAPSKEEKKGFFSGILEGIRSIFGSGK